MLHVYMVGTYELRSPEVHGVWWIIAWGDGGPPVSVLSLWLGMN